jgi:hypothetical protein
MAGPMLRELKAHAPFTLFGALTGVLLMLLLVAVGADPERLHPVFEGFHAVHVLLSAVVTAGMYWRYRRNLLVCVAVGVVGSVGIATLSDVVFPHHGGALLLRAASDHAHMHFHLPAVEQWWLIFPVALLGVALGIRRPKTRVPHSGHVLLSTWASLFYVFLHAEGQVNWLPLLPLVFIVLFVAVWVPCCVSDIVFPLLFVRGATADAHEHGAHAVSGSC